MMRTRVEFKSGRKLNLVSSTAHILYSWDSVVKVDTMFTSYRIQSNANNSITLTLSTEALLSALRSSSSSASSSSVAAAIIPSYDADEVVMKLAKKNEQAVLSFEMYGMSRSGRRVRVAHDVRIDVMRPAESDKLHEPRCPDPEVGARFIYVYRES